MADGKVVTPADLALLDPDRTFHARLAADRAAIAGWLGDLNTADTGVSEDQLKLIAAVSHKLAGAAGTFGYADVSDAALALEELILDRAAGQSASAWFEPLSRAADRLIRTVEEALAGRTQWQ